MIGENLYTIEEVASYLQVETAYVQRLIARKKISYIYFNRLYRFQKQDIDEFVSSRRFAFPSHLARYIVEKYVDNVDHTRRIDIAIETALNLAQQNNQPLSSVHLFYGLITTLGSSTKALFDQLTVSPGAVAAAIADLSIETPFSLEQLYDHLIQKTQARLALNEKHDYISTEHVMLYLLDDEAVKSLLQILGISHEQFQNQLTEFIAATSA